jgi:hypothetical protein
MPIYTGTRCRVVIDGTDVSALVIRANLRLSIEAHDATRGSSAWIQRTAGRFDTAFDVVIAYDENGIGTLLTKLRPGVHTVEYGAEGGSTGKPRHVQSMILTDSPFEVRSEKHPVAFELRFVGADAPTVDMFAGGVY